MGFEHRSFEEAGHRFTELVDQASGMRILAAHAGAELISIAHKNLDGTWHGYLYRDGDSSDLCGSCTTSQW